MGEANGLTPAPHLTLKLTPSSPYEFQHSIRLHKHKYAVISRLNLARQFKDQTNGASTTGLR